MRAVALVLSVASAALFAGASQADVKVRQGRLHGSERGTVSEYLAIPYAQPPVGPLRWRDPLPAQPWRGVRDATRASAACMQGPPAAFGPFTSEFLIDGPVSEDCLYLNVWAPTHAAAKAPVYVFIHGGGFGSGSGTIPIYNGKNLAAEGAVVVTVNYRLGVFGYLAHPELTRESPQHSSGNYGLMDMIAALRWVRANIAAFGGDPANITIGGQSAGAAAVNDLIMSPPAKGLFQRAIAESGSGMGLHMVSRADAERNGVQFGARVGAVTLAQLRAIPAAQLAKAAEVPPPAAGKKNAPRISFAPNRDGVVIAADPDDLNAKPVSAVPMLTGFNADEGALFGAQGVTAASFETTLRDRYGASADTLLAQYPHATDDEARRSFLILSRDRPAASLMFWSYARMRDGQPVYTYIYDHPYPASPDGKSFGAFHTSEIPYVFGIFDAGGRAFTDKDRQVSDQLQSHWLAFMRTGNPSTPERKWPTALEQKAKLMGLGDTVGPQWGISGRDRYEALEAYVRSGGQLSLF